jgi:uncharacterized membrane protein
MNDLELFINEKFICCSLILEMFFCFDAFLTKVLTNFDVYTEVNSYKGLKNKKKRNKTKRKNGNSETIRNETKRNETKKKNNKGQKTKRKNLKNEKKYVFQTLILIISNLNFWTI